MRQNVHYRGTSAASTSKAPAIDSDVIQFLSLYRVTTVHLYTRDASLTAVKVSVLSYLILTWQRKVTLKMLHMTSLQVQCALKPDLEVKLKL